MAHESIASTLPIARLLCAISLFGALLRFACLDRRVYWPDECFTSLRISGRLLTGLNGLADGHDAVPARDLMDYQRLAPGTSVVDVLRHTAREEGAASPLYYAAARGWAVLLGDSPAALRGLSALFGVLALPCVYWLALELFGSRQTAWAAAALFAVSPFELFYSQEARWYSLWAAATCLSSAAFLSALRRRAHAAWLGYAASVALGLYSTALFVLVYAAHGLSWLFADRFKPGKDFAWYAAAGAAGGAAFSPWAWEVARHMGRASSNLDWTSRPLPLSHWIGTVLLHLSNVFVNSGWSSGDSKRLLLLAAPFLAAALALCAASLAHLRLNAPRRSSWLVWCLSAAPLAAFALLDLRHGGYRAAVDRYQLPTYIAVQLAAAAFLAGRRPLLIGVLAAGLLSCWLGLRQDTWNRRFFAADVSSAPVINHAAKPLVVYEDDAGGGMLALPLAHRLRPDAAVQFGGRPAGARGDFSDIFYYKPGEGIVRHER